jgi:hypothetical protein
LAGALILLSYASIFYFEGWGKLQEIANPFNLVNFIAVIITLAPGYGLIMIGEKLSKFG